MRKIEKPIRYEDMAPHLDNQGIFKGSLVFDIADLVDCEGPGGFQEICEERAFVFGHLESFKYRVLGHRPPVDENDKGAVIIEIEGEYIGFMSKG